MNGTVGSGIGRSLCLHTDALNAFMGLKQEMKSIREYRSKMKHFKDVGTTRNVNMP